MNKKELTELAESKGITVTEDDTVATIKGKIAEVDENQPGDDVTVNKAKSEDDTAGDDVTVGKAQNDNQQPGDDVTVYNAEGESKEHQIAVSDDEEVLVKMTRRNPLYVVAGYKFSREHPYLAVAKSDVDLLMKDGGFQLATESEVRDYYN